MLKSKYANPLTPFQCHGTKTVTGGETYVLMVDDQGQCLIEQVGVNANTIMFAEMPQPAGTTHTGPTGEIIPVPPTETVIAAAIAAFWAADVTAYSYVYLFQLQ
jgi:hypothetical protein